MVGEYQDWRWKIDLGAGRFDSVDLFLAFSGREEIKINGYIMDSVFSFRFDRTHTLKLSDGSIATMNVKVDWLNFGMPKVSLISEKGYAVEQVLGPQVQSLAPQSTDKDLVAIKYISMGLIWTLPLVTRGGAIPAGFAAGASAAVLGYLANSSLSKPKKIVYVGLTVVGTWVGAFALIIVISMFLQG